MTNYLSIQRMTHIILSMIIQLCVTRNYPLIKNNFACSIKQLATHVRYKNDIHEIMTDRRGLATPSSL